MTTCREGERKGGREEPKRKRENNRIRERGASNPFYSGPDLPGCCQVIVGWSLDRILTVNTTNFMPLLY